MPSHNFPEDANGVGAAIWEEIGDNFIDFLFTREQLLDPTHAINTTLDYRFVFMTEGTIAYKLTDGSWLVGGQILVPDSTPPVISMTVGNVTETGAVVSVASDKGTGNMSMIISSTMQTPLPEYIIAGQEYDGDPALYASQRTVYGVGSIQFPLVGLVNGTTMWAHAVHVDGSGNISNVVTEEFTTNAASGNIRDSFPDPEPQVGKGKATTGGRGYAVYLVTNGDTGQAAGSLRWAKNQAEANGGGNIVPVVNAKIWAEETYDADNGIVKFTGDNITYHGGLAPGTGFINSGARWEFEGDNFLADQWIHTGLVPGVDAGSAGAAADNFRGGLRSTDPSGTHITDGIYVHHSTMINNQDEGATFVPRANNQATGNKVQNFTVDSNFIQGGVGYMHEMACYIADGCEYGSVTRNYMHGVRARAPAFVRQYTAEIELMNNVVYGIKHRPTEILGPSVHVIGNHYKFGPYPILEGEIPSPYEKIYAYGSATVYQTDNTDAGDGGTMTGGPGTFVGSPIFTIDPAFPLVSAAIAKGTIPYAAGATMHGGVRHPICDTMLSEYEDGSLPNPWRTYANALDIFPNGGTYPSHNGNYVPNAYLAIFPEDTDLANVIADGSGWDGYQVFERVSAWFRWDGTIIPTVPATISVASTLPFDFGSDDTQSITIDEPSGTVAYFAISGRAIDNPGVSEALSSYSGTLTDLGEVGPLTEQTLDVKFHIYRYVSDGTVATIYGNTEGGLRRGIDGIIISGGHTAPTGYLDSTDGTDQNSTAISVPTTPAVEIGDFVVGFVCSGADIDTQLFAIASAAGLDNVTVETWGHSNLNSGIGHYWITGTATSTDVGPITATAAGAADYWQAASLVLKPI